MFIRRRLARVATETCASAAVEFSLILPMIVMTIVGIIYFTVLLSTYSALQQISGEAARAALGGLSATEQSQLASSYVTQVIPSYSFIDPGKLTVTTTTTSNTFAVNVSYNASSSFFSNFGGLLSSAPLIITRSSTVQLSGF